MKIDYNFLYWYICGIVFCIVLLITGFNSFNIGQWILIVSIGTVINIMASIHFNNQIKLHSIKKESKR